MSGDSADPRGASGGRARQPVSRLLATGLVLAVASLVLAGTSSYVRIQGLLLDQDRVERTHAVLDDVSSVRVLLRDAERGQRGYLITGREYYLEPYEGARGQIADAVAGLVAETAGTPAGDAAGAELAAAVREKLVELDSTVEVRRERGFEAARAVVATDAGRRAMRRTTAALDVLETEQRAVLTAQRAAGAERAAATHRLVLAGTALALVLVAGGAVWVRRSLVQPVQEVAAAAQRLAAGEPPRVRVERGPREVVEVARAIEGAVGVLVRARDEALAADAAKTSFLATMSHEVRTPMNAVIGMSDLLLQTPLDDRQRELAETVRDSGDALLSTIDQVLDFSRLQSGDLRLAEAPFSVRRVAESAVALLAHEASAKGLELTAHVEAPPATVLGDADRLRQVVVNLLDNAVEFTSRGEVALTVVATPAADAQDLVDVRIAVRDTGTGIAPHDVARLLERFGQLDSSTTRSHGGVGLGLAISSRLVAAMGGRLDVDSVPGIGSTFSVALRLPAGPPLEAGRTAAPSTLAGRHVLVVDDNATNRRVLRLQLEGWGARCTDVASGADALRLLSTVADVADVPAVAVVDMHMPGMDGEQLARAVAQLPAHRRPAVTALLTSVHVPAAAAGGVFDVVLPKPTRSEVLRAALEQALGRAEDPAQGTAGPAGGAGRPAAAPEPAGPAAPARALRVLLAEDNVVNQRVAQLLLARFGHAVQVVADGRAAVEAVREREYDVVLMDLHMPGMDGLEATRRIRADLPADRQPPVVALTASVLTGDRDACAAAGMDEHLTKPVRARELQDVLQRVVLQRLVGSVRRDGERARAAHRLDGAAPAALAGGPAPSPVPSPAPSPVPTADPTADPTAAPAPWPPLEVSVRARLEDLGGVATAQDRELFAGLLTSFADRAPAALAQLREAVLAGDPAAVAVHAHALKGSAANLGAEELAQACAQLEDTARGGGSAGAGQLDELDDLTGRACAAVRALAGELRAVDAPRVAP
ncbi:hybrid sensor histidine kinase/response regulator [Kineococcus terrestris]|uniref:hybrid sensor histidine kinase/response regulator n=1 Tax=Kineococcus terrestris TaxID=2044856 RepID=UPI0034DB0DD5